MKKHSTVFILCLCTIFIFSCNQKITPPTEKPVSEMEEQEVLPVEEEPEGEELPPKAVPVTYMLTSLRKTACFGRCPVYEFKVYTDGRASYLGTAHVDKMGKHWAVVGKPLLEKIQAAAKTAKYFQLEKMYPTDGKFIADIPGSITTFNDGEKEHLIENNYDAPQSLLAYEQFLEKLINDLEWVKE